MVSGMPLMSIADVKAIGLQLLSKRERQVGWQKRMLD